jgi:hypothetical protein
MAWRLHQSSCEMIQVTISIMFYFSELFGQESSYAWLFVYLFADTFISGSLSTLKKPGNDMKDLK